MEHHPWLNPISSKSNLDPNFSLNSFQGGNLQLVQAPSSSPNAQSSPLVRSHNSSPNADQLLASGSQSLLTSEMDSTFSEMRPQPSFYSFILSMAQEQRSLPNAQSSPSVRSRNSSPIADQLLASGSQSLSPSGMARSFSGMRIQNSFAQSPVHSPALQLVQTPNSSPNAQLPPLVSHNSSPNADQLLASGSHSSSPPGMDPSEMKVPNLLVQSPLYSSALYAIRGDPPPYSESRQCTQTDEMKNYAVLETYQPHQTYQELQEAKSFPATDALSCLKSLNAGQFYPSVLDQYQDYMLEPYSQAREDYGSFRLAPDGIGSAGSSINSSPIMDHEQNSGGKYILKLKSNYINCFDYMNNSELVFQQGNPQ
ncbi:hypothetical protein TNCV_4775041 [Trichonephila clavipes]|nr:hypothetical protein TNCV_4775041 [Trichonephila clavipes]